MAPRLLLVLLAFLACSGARATDVLSFHNNQQSTGQNLAETKLTPASVTVGNFQRRFVLPVDGQVYAQPLYKAGVNITAGEHAGLHNVAFVATQHGTVYAVDSLSGLILWQRSLLTDGLPDAISITTVPYQDIGSEDIMPEIGIVSTPVIDPATGMLYATVKTKQMVASDPVWPRYVCSIFKLDIGSGAIAGSKIIAATYKPDVYVHRTNADPAAPQDPFIIGTGHGAIEISGQNRVYFNAQRQMNRPGLLLLDGEVYTAWGSHSDNGPYHGWLIAFDAQTLAVTRVLNTTPNGGLAGIWQAGGIPVVDEQGFIYINTGNGTFDGGKGPDNTTIGLDANGFPVNGNYGNCFLKLARDPASTVASQNINGWGLKVVDYFCPYNTESLNTTDSDLGSGGPVVLPDEVGSPAHPHLLIGAGKEGKLYLLDRDNMGKFDANTDHVVQTQGNAITGCVNTPAYLNGKLYWVGGYSYDYAKIFAIGGASISPTPLSRAPRGFSFPGATPSISAHGLNNVLVWVLERSSNELRAYDGLDFTSEIWTSNLAPNDRDKLGTVVKFTAPTVADGLVFVGTTDSLVVYGPPQPPQTAPAAPVSLTASAASGIEVNLSWVDKATNEDGFELEQSTDGVNFTKIDTLSVNEASASVIALQPGSFYYFRVRAYNSFGETGSFSAYSNVVGVATQAQPPTLKFANGFTGAGAVLQVVGAAKFTETAAAQLSDAPSAQVGAIWTKQVRNVARFTTEFTFRASDGAEGLTFCIQRVGPAALGAGGAGLGYQGLRNSVALKFDLAPNLSATGLYALGANPGETQRSVDVIGAGLDFHSGHLFRVLLTYNKGVLTQTILDTEGPGSFTKHYAVNIPAVIGGSQAYLGFTGAGAAAQRIHSWTYAALPAVPPAAPTDLRARAASGTQLNLFWRDNAGSEAGFIIGRRVPPETKFTTIGVVGPNVAAYMDTALTPLQPYEYQVRATNAAGVSTPTATVRGKTPVPPITPSGARAVKLTATRIVLAWKDNAANENRYAILRKEGEDGEFKPLIVNLPPNTTTYVDNDVKPGTTYDYHVQCLNIAGYSDFSGVLVTTPAQ